jgi:hypothetical protein
MAQSTTVNDSLVRLLSNLQQAGPLTDRSGTATSASSQVAAANTARSYLLFQNTSGSDVWINFGVAAVTAAPSLKVTPNTTLEWKWPGFVPTDALNVIAGGSQTYTAKEA